MNEGHAACELSEPFLEFFFIVIRLGLLDLPPYLLAPRL